MSRSRRGTVAAALGAMSKALGRRADMVPRRSDVPESPLTPQSDEQSMAEVVEAARQIVRAARLQDVTGGFLFEACNDQGRPPYRGRVDMSFAIPDGSEADAHFAQIAAVMVEQGWTAGPPPGKRPVGVVIHTEACMAIICVACGSNTRGAVQVSGQCGNMSDHRRDGTTVGTDITDQLSGR